MNEDLKKFTYRKKKFLLDENTSSIYCVTSFNVNVSHKKRAVYKWKKEFREISPQLQLCLSMACNLNCKYCVFRKRELENSAKMMELRTAMDAIKMFFEILPKDQKYARIDFGVTGEPFIAEKHHAVLKKYIKKLCVKYKKTVWVGANMSNGLIFNPEKMITRLGSPMDISIDGTKCDHDKFRKYKNQKGTYDDLVKLIGLARNKKIDVGACSVVTADTLNISKNFKHIFDLGIRSSIYMKPVNSSHENGFSLNKKNLSKFKKAYERFVDFLLDSSDEDLVQYLKTINPEDFFFRFFYRILNRTMLRYRCNAGKSGLYADWDGKIYPCAHFVGARGRDIGNVKNGIDNKAEDFFLHQTIENRKPCNRCWARYFCGGGCYYQAWLANKTIEKPDGVKCQLIKHFIKLQAYFISELIQKRRGVLENLGNPYFSGAINSVPPQKRGAFSPREIGSIGKKEVCESVGSHRFCFSFSENKLRVKVPKNNSVEIHILLDKTVKRIYQWDDICFYKDVSEYDTYVFKDGKMMVHNNKTKKGFIEIPFNNNIWEKADYLVKSGNVIEFPIPNKTKVGFNIEVSDGDRTFLLVPENFGILKLDQKFEKSKINHPRLKDIYSQHVNKKVFPLWIDNSSSDLFNEKNDYISYDSSVC